MSLRHDLPFLSTLHSMIAGRWAVFYAPGMRSALYEARAARYRYRQSQGEVR